MYEYSDNKRPGAIIKPASTSKIIESRSKSYSDLSSKHHLRSNNAFIDEEPVNQGQYIVGWGRNKFHEYPIGWNTPIIEIACGEKHSVFLTNKFQLFVCGDNQYGQLGCPTQNFASISTPLQIMKDKSIANVFCGPYNTFVITSKGEVYGMGLNSRGQLGIGNEIDQKMGPILIESLSVSNRRGRQTSRGRIVTAMQQVQGILTDRQASHDNVPLRECTPEKRYKFFEGDEERKALFDSSDYVKQVTCGPFHTLVLTSKGRVFSSGLKLTGDLSSNDYSIEFSEFKQKALGVSHIEQISSSMTLNAARTSEGRVYVWGVFNDIVLSEPTLIELRNIIEVSLGCEHQCLLTSKAEVYQLYSDESQKIKTKKIDELPHVRTVRCGADFAMAIATQTKQVYAWGRNRYGQIVPGKASPAIFTSPVICQNTEVSKLFCGSYHSICLTKKPVEKEESVNFMASRSRKKQRETEEMHQSEELKQKSRKKEKKSVRIQTQPMSKFDMTPNINSRTFSSTLEIPFSELTLEEQISEGGYGIIYKGKWRQTTVAIKLFKIDTSQSSVKDFLSECHAMQALRHPNIVLFLGACTKPPNFAIVLEYCQKGTLWSILQSNVDLSWEDRRRFALDTARGMNYLHSSQIPILHRDLKSLNLLLDESYRVKLADFGWTKGLENYMTQKIGTYQWMAPEVISGQKYTQKADVFSFGIILWQIASRQPPYRNVSGIQVSIEVANNHLRPMVPKKTPDAFAKLMRRCWDRNPQNRPSFRQTIRELETMKLNEGK